MKKLIMESLIFSLSIYGIIYFWDIFSLSIGCAEWYGDPIEIPCNDPEYMRDFNNHSILNNIIPAISYGFFISSLLFFYRNVFNRYYKLWVGLIFYIISYPISVIISYNFPLDMGMTYFSYFNIFFFVFTFIICIETTQLIKKDLFKGSQ